MLSPLPSPSKEVDVSFLVFVQRHATDLLRWDLLSFFAHNPDCQATVSQLVQVLGRSSHAILPELGDLKILGILEQDQTPDRGIRYQLTKAPAMRRMALKFADQLKPKM